jgi:hypothetical protein
MWLKCETDINRFAEDYVVYFGQEIFVWLRN